MNNSKNVIRSFFGFSTFVFFLYCMKVSSVLSVPTAQNIINVMKNDTELSCKIPTFLYENNIIADCHDVAYPEGQNITYQHDLKSMNTFLCLAFYDTIYKVCHSSQHYKYLTNMTTFYSYIYDFFPGKEESDQTMFCKNIKDIKFAYKKVEPLLSHVHLNNSHTCYSICLDMSEKFVPLCAILAWNKNIDDTKQINTNLEKEPEDVLSTKIKTNHETEEQQFQVADKTFNRMSKENTDNTKSKIDKSSTINVLLPKKQNSAKPVVKSNTNSYSNNHQQIVTYPTEKKIETNVEKADVPENLGIASNTDDKIGDEKVETNPDINNGAGGNINDVNEDVKTSTISENTQDHQNPVNEDEWNPIADQNQHIPEPSEQRDIIPHYSIRTDEESHFFTYFTVVSLISVAAYIGYHNKQKILAIVLEGRRSRNSRSRRRPSTANYRKLDCTLEEAVTSQCNANVTHVIY
ncbi:hypothetical protein E2986_08591 [Frieseomelitta varia]|uniref:Uncharacterized protein n=1 Tax=Frieseomelitta varia TaxID=561572 RepID=A0A833VYQ3_9HYME|nr:hypothetical protein E2986_08591 [Frieseomelitta varia]